MLEPQPSDDFERTSLVQRPTEPPNLVLPGFLDDSFDDDSALDQTRKPWWRRWWVIGVAGVLLIALVLGGWAYMSQSRAPQTTYQYATIANGNLTLTVSATGPVQAGIYNLNFATSGQIAEIDVTVGQQVAARQVLAKLDTTALQAAVNLAQQQANVAYDQEQAAIAACSTERNPPVDCVQQAKNAYAAVINQLQTAQRNLAGATLTAPHAGVVNAINGSVGSAPSTGGSGTSSSAFIQVVDPSSLTLSASVNEADIGDITVGQQATFTVTSYKGVMFHATVASISQVGSSTSSVVTYPVTFTVDMTRLQGAHLLSGMTTTVTITRAQRVNVLLVPASAVTFGRAAASTTSGGFLTRTQVSDVRTQAQQLLTTLQAQNPQISQESPALAWVLERTNGKWVVKPVVLGLSNGSTYEVLAGLTVGETVVTGETNGSIKSSSSSGTSGTSGGGFPGGGGGGFPGGGGGGRGGNGG